MGDYIVGKKFLFTISFLIYSSYCFSDELEIDLCDRDKINTVTTLSGLKPCMESKYRDDVGMAVWWLSMIQDKRAPNILINIWNGKKLDMFNVTDGYIEDVVVRIQAVKGLLKFNIGKKSDYTDFIYRQASNPDPFVRNEVASVLSQFGDTKAVHTLAAIVKYDYVNVSYNALTSLINIYQMGPDRDEARQAILNLYNNIESIRSATVKTTLEEFVKHDFKQNLPKMDDNM